VSRIQLWNGDICELEVDEIVNPANPSLWMSTGVGQALDAAYGAFERALAAPVGIDVVAEPARSLGGLSSLRGALK
jgi:O-acetyl-ADP-ribose deacetylase (regulator of RNase III)